MSGRLLSQFRGGLAGRSGRFRATAANVLSGAALLAGVLTWLAAVLFAGRVLTMLDEHWESFVLTAILSGAGEHFWRILRLSVLGSSATVWPGAWDGSLSVLARKNLRRGNGGLAAGRRRDRRFRADGPSARVGGDRSGLCQGPAGERPDPRALQDAPGSFRSFFRHFRTAMSVWLMNALLFALLGVVYLQFSNGCMLRRLATILMLLFVQQGLHFSSAAARRVALWASGDSRSTARSGLRPPGVEPDWSPTD